MKKTILFLCLCYLVGVTYAQEPFRVMFYNVENLFDCQHDTLKNDYEFLPDAPKGWTQARYHDKLARIAKVIIATGEENVPDLVGLCEVENDHCLKDLTENSPLREAGYRYVMTDSPDERGIDVALLYQRGTFKLVGKNSLSVPYKEIERRPTRDILHVMGQVASGDTLDVFVCHMPSRAGGEEKSEPYRLFTAQILKIAAGMRTSYDKAQILKYPFLCWKRMKNMVVISHHVPIGERNIMVVIATICQCVWTLKLENRERLVVSDEWTALLCRRC